MITKKRDRVCAAIIKDNEILMVYTEAGERSHWTLPGGGIEKGETHIEAVVNVEVSRLLFNDPYEHGDCFCYLVNKINDNEEPRLGYDPELERDKQVLKEIAWKDMGVHKDDMQVSKVIIAMKR